jgi:hypothetical protein
MYTFADIGPKISAGQRLNNLIEEIELADQGLMFMAWASTTGQIMRLRLRLLCWRRLRHVPRISGLRRR